jgi:hypothetical protein
VSSVAEPHADAREPLGAAPLLACRELHKRFGSTVALDGASLPSPPAACATATWSSPASATPGGASCVAASSASSSTSAASCRS